MWVCGRATRQDTHLRSAAFSPIHYPGGNRREGYRRRGFSCPGWAVRIVSLRCKENLAGAGALLVLVAAVVSN
jgi:hypothetical protein